MTEQRQNWPASASLRWLLTRKATALVGNTSPYDLTDTLGKCIGAQIKEIVPNFADQLRLLDILAKSTARGMYGDLKTVKEEIGSE